MSDMWESIRKKLYKTNEYGVSHQDPDAVLSESQIEWLKKHYDINTDWHPTCINCQARQLMKYKDTFDKEGKNDKFKVPCQGIRATLPPGSSATIKNLVTEKGMDPERAKLLLMASFDPVYWYEMFFGGYKHKLRPYQKEQLRCTSQRIAVREGRRTGKTWIIAVKLIYLAMNRLIYQGLDPDTGEEIYAGPRIMIVTPNQSQVHEIFDTIEGLLKYNKALSSRVVTGSAGSLYTKTPICYMEFDNGAVIKGFVSGVGSKTDGTGGGPMRGQFANIIYLDEMDMIPAETIEKVIMPIIMGDEKGEVQLIITSTPIGKQAHFHKWCTQDPYWKEDYLPSTVLPQWNALKRDAENEGTKETFDREYMAAFVDSEYGVFKAALIAYARKEYSYTDCRDEEWWRTFAKVRKRSDLVFSIGIDWNKNAGSEFCVTAYDPNNNRFIVCETTNIPAGTFSALEWKREVRRLNHIWQPEYIYADQGYGHTIIEELKLMAYELQGNARTEEELSAAKLVDRLKAFDFKANVELRNPMTNVLIKKSGKHYIVENTVRLLETEQIWFSMHDIALKSQLESYVVLSRSKADGKPVYGPATKTIGDHRLDAFMLSLAGITLNVLEFKNVSEPGDPGYVNPVRFEHESPAFIKRVRKSLLPLELLFGDVARGVNFEPPEPMVTARERGKFSTHATSSVYDYFKNNVINTKADFDADRTPTSGEPLVVPRKSRRPPIQRRRR